MPPAVHVVFSLMFGAFRCLNAYVVSVSEIFNSNNHCLSVTTVIESEPQETVAMQVQPPQQPIRRETSGC